MKQAESVALPCTPEEKEVLRAIDQGWLLDNVSRLVAFPSHAGRERGAQEFMAELLSEVGFDVDVWEIDEPSLRAHPVYATEIERDTPLGVVGTLAGTAAGKKQGRTLVFNGHVDVVPPGDPARWATPPFECRELQGRLYGRGVLDMKGPLVAALAGIRAVARTKPSFSGSLLFQSVIGEEDGGLGTLAAVLRGHTGDAAVVFEPTGLSVAAAQAGALNFRLTVPGKAAHGALRFEGVSAIENFMFLYQALMDLEAARNRGVDDPRFGHLKCPYPICVGTVQGGEWASSVAARVTAEGRFGVPVGESVDVARQALELGIRDACRRHDWLRTHPARLAWWGGQFAPCETGLDAEIVEVAMGVASSLVCGQGQAVGVPYGSDLRLLVNQGGMPGILFGPGNIAGAHRENESVEVAELMDGARAAALLLMRFLA